LVYKKDNNLAIRLWRILVSTAFFDWLGDGKELPRLVVPPPIKIRWGKRAGATVVVRFLLSFWTSDFFSSGLIYDSVAF
jgi:hypothetical protein